MSDHGGQRIEIGEIRAEVHFRASRPLGKPGIPVAAAYVIQLSCATRPFGSKAPIPGWPGKGARGAKSRPKPAVPSSFGDGKACRKILSQSENRMSHFFQSVPLA